jgi:hypothetical protein
MLPHLTCSINRVSSVEAVYRTSTVTPRVVEGDEKGTRYLGCDWATMSLEDIIAETWSSRLVVGRKADDLAL